MKIVIKRYQFVRFIGNLHAKVIRNRMEQFNWLRLDQKMIRWFINNNNMNRTKFENLFFFLGFGGKCFAWQCMALMLDLTECETQCVFEFTTYVRPLPSTYSPIHYSFCAQIEQNHFVIVNFLRRLHRKTISIEIRIRNMESWTIRVLRVKCIQFDI